MDTIYDWLTVCCFAALVILYLHRSIERTEPRSAIWHYLIAAIACAIANWLGNNDEGPWALATLAAGLIYVVYFLRPFLKPRR
jgi:hypothetical protein